MGTAAPLYNKDSFLPSTSVLTLFALLVAYIIVPVIRDPHRHIPGPFSARFTRLWHLYAQVRGDLEKANIALHEKYGPIVRYAPNKYSFNTADAIETIYAHGSDFAKSDWYTTATSPKAKRPGLFQETNIDRHAERRRKVAGLYTMTTVAALEPSVTRTTKLLVEKFEVMTKENKEIDLQVWMQYCKYCLQVKC
jgi:cytochrome P450